MEAQHLILIACQIGCVEGQGVMIDLQRVNGQQKSTPVQEQKI